LLIIKTTKIHTQITKALKMHKKYTKQTTKEYGEKSSIQSKAKGKGIPSKPGQALRVLEVRGSQMSRQSPHEGGKVASPTHRPPLPPKKYSWYPRAIVLPEGLCQ